MALAKRDPNQKERQLDALFPIDKEIGIWMLLKYVHQIREARFLLGDYDASILLLDFYHSYEQSKLTNKQKQVIQLVFEEDQSYGEVARYLGITVQAVQSHIMAVVKKIAAFNRQNLIQGKEEQHEDVT